MKRLFIDGFFGWNNIKWFIREIGKVYSSDSESSFFSKKRIESSIAFIIGQYGMIRYFNYHYAELSISDITLCVTIEFLIAGYYVNKIQEQKKD